ncbi:MAG: NADH-quinone oxidoreductase subunit C [Saprospiraceae bacterium]|nr:NADH-quinone oxidoreductase subunit C [Saprospiraceae bacterium]MCB0542613.1 NADH-quinone oxidoreductase subunit C [Saprospiraceae bacterium]MCB0574218.1 NADH-quinone oxidoreductase subunit C [Saprospiraceae bacterium]MCB9305591.1 NADH-quinone oxidoreductase subunit C [Lewinellaceae bacterium]MCB9355014.1 NADH-quinone oxidoreductase subunit C [Lewinellaceae bacterium]
MQLDNATLHAAIERRFPGAILDHGEPYGMLTLETTREHLPEMLRFVKEDPEIQANFLTSLCGMHYPEQKGKELGLVYHLHSFVHNLRFRIKAFFPIDDPHAPSMTALWPTANWMERQEYDFFGIIFDGHPDLRRILNVDDLDVFPMRKEYKLEDGTRTDKDDRFFGRDGHEGRSFD